jgi:uncharacterized protein (TIGR02270 family)
MNAAQTPVSTVSPYNEIYEQMAVDAAFLWLLRSIAVDQPHYTVDDLVELEQRIDAQLDGLMTAPEESWEICRAAMDLQEPGEVFAGAVLAFRSLDVRKIQAAVEVGIEKESAVKGLISALGWLPGRLCHSWIKKFLTSKDLDHKYVAISACSIRREDPRDYLTAILQREDCLAHAKLYARSLRLIGELKRHDLMPALRPAMLAEEPSIRFWASWSAVLLGDRSALANLRPFALELGPYQGKAIDLAFRALTIDEGRSWINALAKDPAQIRNVIKATATLGDPHAVNWLIGQMRLPALTRLAGEAFTTITGIDLKENALALEDLPDLDEHLPNDDPEDENVDMDEDENLPFPDVAKVAAVWQKYQQRFVAGQRYFMGKTITLEDCESFYGSGSQRQRRISALQLALLQQNNVLPNYRQKQWGA